MKPFIFLLLLNAFASHIYAQKTWTVLKHYDANHLANISLPLGGIGTGTVSLGGRGELRDWQIMNKPGIRFNNINNINEAPFFSIFIAQPNKKSITKALIGPLYENEYMNQEGRPANNYGQPRFEKASFDAAYPFGQVHLSDSELPVTVNIKGFNPLIPADEENSGIPIAVLRYEVTNNSTASIDVSIAGTVRNFIGVDGSKTYKNWNGDIFYNGARSNVNEFKKSGTISGVYMYSDSVDKADPAWGNFAITTNAKANVSYRLNGGNSLNWYNDLMDFWDDFSADGELTNEEKKVDDPMASLAVKQTIAPGQTVTYNFYLTWYFPNRYAWPDTETKFTADNLIGNYYTTRYSNAWDVIEKTLPKLDSLEDKTLQFVKAFTASTYPLAIKEAALFNLAVLRSQTVFRLPDGHMMGWEGVMNDVGSCLGSCTHVWNYEQATPFLFGKLARTMRDIEFNYSTMPSGEMKFRTTLPLTKPQTWWGAAADGQMGCIMKMYREWQLSGDNAFLQSYWPKVKSALRYAWRPGGWDGNKDGVMEGEQHNTMDVNYYGPNPQMEFWYLGALKAAQKMALFVNDKAFADTCADVYNKGSKWIDANLFNGEYYEQKITDPKTFKYLQPGDPVPDLQLGNGCLVDQLVGQMMASILDLGWLADSTHERTTLNSILKYNYLSSFKDHFNNMRSYVLGNEAGLVMGSYPKGRPKAPFPYFNESMTGFEYAAATSMLYAGDTTNGINAIQNIRNRFDGSKRNPFNEPECGYFYARSMTSWAGILAYSGFHYSGVDKSITFTQKPGSYFWSNGYSWGTADVAEGSVTIKVLSNSLALQNVTLGNRKLKLKTVLIKEGEEHLFKL